jgi:hypothetical protein
MCVLSHLSQGGKTMENQLPLQDRVIASLNEAERLSAMLEQLETPETAMVAFGLLPDWSIAARQAIQLCRLACTALSHEELSDLIDCVGECLWEHYVLAEWYDTPAN